MPFPWKKTKSGARISQFVAGRILSSKQGAVQTGFPTSLVDLFHKNRDRLKKCTNKRRSTGRDLVVMSPPVAPPTTEMNPSNLSNLNGSDLKLAKSRRSLTKLENQPKGITEVENQGKGKSVNRENVFAAIFKIFFVVVLALGTKRLVVGVSMSAFLLFFLEFLGKYVYELLKPCLNSHRRVLFFVGIKEDNKFEGEANDSDCCGLVKGNNFNAPIAEMQIVQALDPPVVQIVKVDCNKRFEYEEEEDCNCDCEVIESKQKGSCRAKIRSKMKKLVPKKLRKLKEKGLDSKTKVMDSTEEDKYEEKDNDVDVEQFECFGEICDNGNEDISDTISNSCELLQSDWEASVVVAKAGRETMETLGYWVLCLIVLAGLVGGRSLAVVLTLVWCLLLKVRGIQEEMYKAAHRLNFH